MERASAKILKLLFLWVSSHDKLSFTKTSRTWAQGQHLVASWETKEDYYIPSSHLVTEIFHLLCLQKMSLPWCWLGCSNILLSSLPVAHLPYPPPEHCRQTSKLLWVPECCCEGECSAGHTFIQYPPTLGGIFWREVQHIESYLCSSEARVEAVRGEKTSAPVTSQMRFMHNGLQCASFRPS